MPTYEYECTACGKGFEAFQSMSEKPLTVCELCGAKKARRRISAGGGLLFKGSGYYTTDYRSDSYKSGAKKEADAAKPAPSEGCNGKGKSGGCGSGACSVNGS